MTAARRTGTRTNERDPGAIDDPLVSGAAQQAANLSDLDNAAEARGNLGLGAAAQMAVGTTAGTVASGNDSRIMGAATQDALDTVENLANAALDGVLGSAAISVAGNLILTRGDGTTINAGSAVGPAGSAATVGTPKGTWNAATNTPTLSNGSGTLGDSYVVATAGSTSLDGESGWTIGDIAYRGNSTWSRIPASATAGAFASIALTGASITDDGAAAGGVIIADEFGEVVAHIVDDEVRLQGMTIGPAGVTITSATLTAAIVATLTTTTAVLAGATVVADGSAAGGVVIADEFGEILVRFVNDEVQLPGMTASPVAVEIDVGIINDLTSDEATITTGATIGALRIEEDGTGTAGLRFVDEFGEIFAQIDATGLASGFGGSGGSADDATTHSIAEIEARNGVALALAAGMPVRGVSSVATPIWKYTHFISCGQSLSTGAEGAPTLSTAAKYGSLMLGDKTTSVNNGMPAANNATPPTWEVTGVAQFNPLVATAGVSNETVLHGALNTFRRLFLAWYGLPSDTSRLLVGNGAGVGGEAIAALQSGASPNLFNRLTSLMDQANTVAAAAGGTYGIGGLLWLQGESNSTTGLGTYLAALQDIYADFCAAALAETGQVEVPAMFIYQTAAPNVNFDTASLGVQMAQLAAALDDRGVFMVGPTYPYPDSNNLHLVANGYRWLGSQFGKVMFRVLVQGHDWRPVYAVQATLRGREILVDYHVPCPPLVFDDPYLQTGWTSASVTTGGANSKYATLDKGFTVLSTGGSVQAIESVALVSETQVLITLFDVPVAGSYRVRFADGRHNGHGSLRDSDATLADDIYLDGQAGQVAGEANATLSGARYPLWNWAVTQQTDVENLA